MFFIYLLLFLLIFISMRLIKLKEYFQFVYIFLGFTSLIFLFNDFNETLDLSFVININYVIPIMLIHSLYLLVNNDLKNNSLCNEFHIVFYLALILNYQLGQIICLLGLTAYKIVLIEKTKLKINKASLLLILVAALSRMSLSMNDFVALLFISLLIVDLFRKISVYEMFSFGLSFTIIPFSSTSLKIISFILVILTGIKFFTTPRHFEKIKNYLLSFKILERIQTYLKITHKPIVVGLGDDILITNVRSVKERNYKGLNFDYELFLLLIIFIYMVAL